MSRSQSSSTPSFAPTSVAPVSSMAQALATPIIAPLPSLDRVQRCAPQPIHLPPLSIPLPARIEPRQADLPRPHRLPAIQSTTTYPLVPPPPIAEPRRRRSPGPAVSLADILSPHPSTPSRSESGFSPRYESRRSPPRSFVDPLPLPRHGPERFAQEAARASVIGPEPSYTSPVQGPYRPHSALIPSPTYTPTYDYGPSRYRSGYDPQRGGPAGPAPLPAPQTETAPGPHQAIACPSTQGPDPERTQLRYDLRVRQQPIAARACGFGERDRRVIDPPPIIQLIVRDPKTGTVDLDELRYSLNIVHCTLWSEDGRSERTALQQPDRRTTRRLMGQLVASPSVAKDEHDVEGCFFCFPDLSCRTHGRYRLRFVLIRLDPSNLHVGSFSPVVTEVLSNVFTVYTAKDFPGMRPSSALTRALKLQGCNIQVKKGNEKALARKRRSIDDSNEDRDDEAMGVKRRKGSA